MKLLARRVKQNGTIFYETAIPAMELINENVFHPDRWNTISNEGYQREINEPHAQRIANYLSQKEGDNVLPTSIIINYRQPFNVTVIRDDLVEINIPASLIGFIVDGQHRITGVRKAVDDGRDMDNYEFGVTITRFSLDEEMVHFRNINTSANRPPKGLSQIINAKLSQEFGRTASNLTEQATDRVVAMVSRLTSDPDSPWYGRIAMGGLRKRSFHTTVQSQFVHSFLPMFISGRFYDPTERSEHIYQILLNYWRAVQTTWPEAMNNPDSSVIQRIIGLEPLNQVLNRILNNVKLNPTYEDFISILSAISKNLELKDSDWDRAKGKISDRRYGYSTNRGHTIIADYLWTGVDSRVKSALGVD